MYNFKKCIKMKIYSNYASLKRALHRYFPKSETVFANGWIQVFCPVCSVPFNNLYDDFLKKTDLYSCVRSYVFDGENFVFYISSDALK